MKHPGKRRVLHCAGVTLALLAAACGASALLLRLFSDAAFTAVPLFILAVALIARLTDGYFWGILATPVGVFLVNWLFTFPYGQLNLRLDGYPLTFTVMLLVSLMVSALTTQVKHQEQIRLEMEMEKQHLNLLRSFSHDIRTPLTSIMGSSDVLLRTPDLDPEARDALLREIHDRAVWLNRVSENMLSITKFSAGSVRLRKSEEVMEEIIASAIRRFRTWHPDIRFTVSKPDEILLAPMDPVLMEQLLLNLFDNAAIHGKATSEISVTLSAHDRGLRVTVADNGGGIDPEVLPHLFDGRASEFSRQGDNAKGMGLGLTVCRAIAAAHGGELTARNTETGAVLEFTLSEREESHENP